MSSRFTIAPRLRQSILRGLACSSLGLFSAGAAGIVQTPPEKAQFFEQKIRPLLVEHCYECHSAQAKKVKGGLLLDTKKGWESGGDSGQPAVVPGKPDESLLIQAVRHEDKDTVMPPKKPKLQDALIADLVEWVKMGAPDPRQSELAEAKRGDKSWWSLQPLTHPQPPSPAGIPDEWKRNPIDRFIFAKLAEKGLKPGPPATPREFIRRVTYDLTGLPPTPEEVDQFLRDLPPSSQGALFSSGADDTELAVERLVDRLLASPHYGEQWGRHWLDVVRFGESNGFERNFIINNAWPFRDYVIRSFNEDKPFNQFIIEHLAGDIVGKGHPETEVGVAFLTIGPYDDVGNQDPVAQANIRAATLDDMVTATGSTFLGLTINCARCHNHKFDPIPTEDYYRVKAAFEGVTHGPRVLATPEERRHFEDTMAPLTKRRGEIFSEKEALENAIMNRAETAPLASTRPTPSARLTEETFAPVEARYVRMTMLANSDNPVTAAGARMDEFEVWTTGPEPRNAALASAGAKAEGVAGKTARDFAGAYSVHMVNDGKYGAQWFIGSPAILTITLAQPETIERIAFSHNRKAMSDKPIPGIGPSVVEYEIHVSSDGQHWKKVADSFDRKPYSPAHARERQIRRNATDDERTRRAELSRELAAVDAQIRNVRPLPTVWAGNFSQPTQRPIVFKGGNPMRPGEEVKPASLNVLDKSAPHYELPIDAPESERRLALAKWIASDDNPLTARVLVNRLWHYHFGAGIVDTPGDFGFLGGKPTHPELLDWMANRLHEQGWRIKSLQREIVLSQTYRQSAVLREDAARVDKDARLLWRFPPRRLAAEEVRDTMLQVAGKLDLRMGGPGFRLYDYKSDNVSTYVPLDVAGPETYRRAVYHQSARASVVDVLTDFDLPDNAFAAPKRANTTTPLQTLTLLNSQFTLDMANALATRLANEAGSDPAAQVTHAFAVAFQREPLPIEREAALKLIKDHGLPAFCRAMLNANELLYLF
jgi:mono/diheme cytochrome c family protein